MDRLGMGQAGSGQASSGQAWQWGASVGREIDKILVANRGEIACRVMRTGPAPGHADRHGVQRRGARHASTCSARDEAVRDRPRPRRPELPAGGAPSSQQPPARGAQAVHPGYGFLSENADFAETLRRRPGSSSWVLPCAGHPSHGRQERRQGADDKPAGVPVVPGYHGEDQSQDRLEHEAGQVGVPTADQGHARRRRGRACGS